MPIAHFSVVALDCPDPMALAEFWAIALDYEQQPPPPGFDSWESFADAQNIPHEDRDRFAAIVDPEGTGPRLLFLKVPESKSAKNRMHLDVVSSDPPAHVARLVAAGASEVESLEEFGTAWTVMADPEGNEFCVVTGRGAV